MKALLKERDRQINEMYGLRMDITKRIRELEDKNLQIEGLEQQFAEEREKSQKSVVYESQISQLKGDVKEYMDMLTKVMRHFKTLLKYLNDQVYTTKDPTVIEHTSRQIKAINALKTDVKQSMKSTNKRN